MKKKCQVVMLPTEKASNIHLEEDKLLMYYIEPRIYSNTKAQHLYILSDEKYKANDWLCDINTKEIYKAKVNSYVGIKFIHKIIATTNPELIIEVKDELAYNRIYTKKLLKIPQNFIESYIKDYNNKKPIKEIMVEYYHYSNSGNTALIIEEGFKSEDRVKYDLNDAIIINKLEQKIYTREEVLEIARKAAVEGFSYSSEGMNFEYGGEDYKPDIDKWFNQNYPE